MYILCENMQEIIFDLAVKITLSYTATEHND